MIGPQTLAPAHVSRASSLDSGWTRLSRLIAILTVVAIAMRLRLPYEQFAGTLLSLALAPAWLPVVWRNVWGRRLILIGLGAALLGIAMTWIARDQNPTSWSLALIETSALLGLLASVGALYWARTYWSDGAIVAWYGIGTLLAIRPSAGMFHDNPWKFGFSVGVTLLLLGLVQFSVRVWPAIVVLLGLGLMSALNDARSSFAILLISAVLLVWQALPRRTVRRSTSVLRLAFTLGAVTLATYNLGQALILEGALGAATQARSAEQVNAAGSLLLGGRPELGATFALLLHRPWGFGSGTFLNWDELMIAKAGMARLNYDPDNGYVERYMFGQGIELHSTAADLWARFGLLGAALVLVMVLIMLRAIATQVSTGTASAVLIFLTIKTAWNLAFGPLYSSVTLMVLLLGLALASPKQHMDAYPDSTQGPPQSSTQRAT